MTYADSDDLETMTNEVKEAMGDVNYLSLSTLAITHGDRKVNNKLQEKDVPIPESPEEGEEYDDRIIGAATLYAAAFILNTYYSGNDNISPTAKAYTEDADNLINGYIEEYLSEAAEEDSVGPGMSILIV